MTNYTFTAEQVQNAIEQYGVTGHELAWHLMDNLGYDATEIERAADGVHSFYAELNGEKITITLQ